MVDRQEEMLRRAENLGLISKEEFPVRNENVPEAEDDTLNAFCSELDKATGSESGAQEEYARLKALARGAGLDNEADAIDMIQGQEKTHQNRFEQMKERQCK